MIESKVGRDTAALLVENLPDLKAISISSEILAALVLISSNAIQVSIC